MQVQHTHSHQTTKPLSAGRRVHAACMPANAAVTWPLQAGSCGGMPGDKACTCPAHEGSQTCPCRLCHQIVLQGMRRNSAQEEEDETGVRRKLIGSNGIGPSRSATGACEGEADMVCVLLISNCWCCHCMQVTASAGLTPEEDEEAGDKAVPGSSCNTSSLCNSSLSCTHHQKSGLATSTS